MKSGFNGGRRKGRKKSFKVEKTNLTFKVEGTTLRTEGSKSQELVSRLADLKAEVEGISPYTSLGNPKKLGKIISTQKLKALQEKTDMLTFELILYKKTRLLGTMRKILWLIESIRVEKAMEDDEE
jgi:hypothetical protein